LARFPSFSLGGREKSIVQDIGQHLQMVKQCVIAYQNLVWSCASSPRDKEPRELLQVVFDLETKAKDKRRDISGRIAEGAFFGGIREDILNLIGTDDKIADKAKDAARLLAITAEERTEEGFFDLLRTEHMKRFQENLLAAVTSLETLIEALQKDKRSVLGKVRSVEYYEEAADTEKDHLLRELLGKRETLDPVSIIELRDFIFASDDIADYAENASDVVLVLVAKGYG